MDIFSKETRQAICDELNAKYVEFKELKAKRRKLYHELEELDETIKQMEADMHKAMDAAGLTLRKVYAGGGGTISDPEDMYSIKHRIGFDED